jgi:TatD DNase family protein
MPDSPPSGAPLIDSPLIDSHCHLAGDEFQADLPAVIERAQAAGLERVLVVLDAGAPEEAARVPRLRELWPAIRFSSGIHPHHAGRYADDLARVQATVEASLAASDAIRAIGEIGLDYHYDFAPRDIQREVFARQIGLARQRRLPIIIHTREADADTLDLLRQTGQGGDQPDVRGVFHCFTGDEALARGALDLGFYVSFSGIATFPRAESLRAIAAWVPADRVLIETDSPYLAPPPYRGKRNEPAWVARVAEVISQARGEAIADLRARTTANFHALFEP